MRTVIGLFLVVFCQQVSAWGADGHQLICQLAYNSLSPKAKVFVDDTLALGEKSMGHANDTFADACLWPDEARFGDYKGTYEHHFINIPRAAPGIDFARDCSALDCIAVAIQRYLTYLARPAGGTREQERKATALAFLGHFVGDLHQPLHVAHGEDWGGNRIQVRWFGKDTNLHRVWDVDILKRANVTFPESADMIAGTVVEPGEVAVLSWMRDTLRLARSHAYANVRGQPVRSGDELGKAYFERSKPVVIEQMALASRRLAMIIEEIVDGTIETNILIE